MATPLSDVKWIHGAADCQANADPLLQVHRFDADTFIMRENKCYSAEGNFMYLLLGTDKALLLDTGNLQDADSLLPRMDLPLAQAEGRFRPAGAGLPAAAQLAELDQLEGQIPKVAEAG